MAVDDAEDDQLASMSTEDIIRASRLLDNEIRVHKVGETLAHFASLPPGEFTTVLTWGVCRTSCSARTWSSSPSRRKSRRTRRKSSLTSSCPTSSAT